MNVIDYAYICSTFLKSNDKVLTKQKDELSDNNKSLLSKGLNFLLPNKKFEIWSTFILLSYFTVKSVILVKIAVIKNFSKVS